MDKHSTDQLYEKFLILSYQLGDDGAFEQLVHRYHPKLRYFLRKLLGQDSDADDILQETWLEAHAGREKLRATEAFAAWIYRIAHNKAMGLMRKQKRLPKFLTEAEIPEIESVEPDEPFSPESAAAINTCLDKLTPTHKEVLVLRFLEDMTYEDIAAVVDCQIGTVRSRIYYARQALRREMENNNHD